MKIPRWFTSIGLTFLPMLFLNRRRFPREDRNFFVKFIGGFVEKITAEKKAGERC